MEKVTQKNYILNIHRRHDDHIVPATLGWHASDQPRAVQGLWDSAHSGEWFIYHEYEEPFQSVDSWVIIPLSEIVAMWVTVDEQ